MYYLALHNPHKAATFLYEVANLHLYPQFNLTNDELIEAYRLILDDLEQVERSGCFTPFAYPSLCPRQIRKICKSLELQKELGIEGQQVLSFDELIANSEEYPVQRLQLFIETDRRESQAIHDCWHQLLEKIAPPTATLSAIVDELKQVISVVRDPAFIPFADILVWLINRAQSSPEITALSGMGAERVGEFASWYHLNGNEGLTALWEVYLRQTDENWRLTVAECIVV